jgi:excisionase family DNA binding protein
MSLALQEAFVEFLGAAVRGAIRSELALVLAPGVLAQTPKSSRPCDELLTVSAAAQFAHVSQGTIRNWLKKGLRRCGHGRTIRIRRQDLEEFMSQPQRGAPLSAEQRAAKIVGGR